MVAYVLFGLQEVSDPQGLKAYRAAAPQSMAGRDIAFLAGPAIAETLEGDALRGAVLMEFPTLAAAQDWYHSPEYQAAAQLRWGSTTCFALILEGR